MKIIIIAAMLAASSLVAHSELFSFYAITSNDSSGYTQIVGENQFSVDITPLSMGQVSLIFGNTGPESSVIACIYFDFVPELNLGLMAINDGNGVEFKAGPIRPKNLPAGQNMNDEFLSDLGVIAKNPAPHNGINPNESLELIMDYNDSYNFLETLHSGDLRIGLHVQSFEGGYSESFVNVIPEPATLPLLFIGSFSLRWLRIKKKKTIKQGRFFATALKDIEPHELSWVEKKGKRIRDNMHLSHREAAIWKAVS